VAHLFFVRVAVVGLVVTAIPELAVLVAEDEAAFGLLNPVQVFPVQLIPVVVAAVRAELAVLVLQAVQVLLSCAIKAHNELQAAQ
jgi:hypothetical protein